ncbi:hypothetical protein TRFO_34355 [Tritrichomonas foetus]|uniref:Uncharacterized protein n=1 Tax=Tritrichomonas foetus TaxID=1144522 RepID=A0A1J4JNW3_9EUKA|nr:hypothetical protein TRFO_34355 [Tritrichomonas foetus]|eukprot:OHS99213.1 hypothetical protein TRFO_34355 [Tritrichomonas foetus]
MNQIILNGVLIFERKLSLVPNMSDIDLDENGCYTIPSLTSCYSVFLWIRTVIYLFIILSYSYQFLKSFPKLLRARNEVLKNEMLFWLFGIITCTLNQLITLMGENFQYSPLKLFTWSLSSAFGACPFMFTLRLMTISFQCFKVFSNIEYVFIYWFSRIIVFLEFIPPILTLIIPSDSTDVETLWLHYMFCLILIIRDTFFLYTMFRLFFGSEKLVLGIIASRALKKFQIGLIIMTLILYLRGILFLIGCIPHYSLRLFYFPLNPARFSDLFTFDYCFTDLVGYALPYVLLAIGVSMNDKTYDQNDNSEKCYTEKVTTNSTINKSLMNESLM